MNPEVLQRRQLNSLLRHAADTEWGRTFSYSDIENYRRYAERVPVHSWTDLQPWVDRLKGGETGLLWPGKVSRYAVSSGTSGKGKHLPLTAERLNSDIHFLRKVAWGYLQQRPNPFPLLGSHLSLPGTLETRNGITLGEVSAYTARHTPPVLKWLQVLSPDEATVLPFEQKLERVLERAPALSPTVITAAPSWILTLFQKVLRATGKPDIASVWPRIRLIVAGGVKLDNYRPHLDRLTGSLQPDYIETYGASEGYFGWTDRLDRDDMRLVTDNGIFYEFIPDPLPDSSAAGIQEAVPLWEVETGRPYGLVVSTNGGLWRYPVNDIVTFTSTDPPRIRVTGRVSEMLDDYGEAVPVHEAESALREACRTLEIESGPFAIHAGLPSERDLPLHRWFIVPASPLHRNTLDRLGREIDRELREKNRHYAIRRTSDALGMPRVETIGQSDINRWLEYNDRNRAQGKLPRVLTQADAAVLKGSKPAISPRD